MIRELGMEKIVSKLFNLGTLDCPTPAVKMKTSPGRRRADAPGLLQDGVLQRAV